MAVALVRMDGRKRAGGTAVFFAAALAALLLALGALAGPAQAVTADEPIVGISGATPAQLEAELDSRNPNHIDPDIARLYVDWGYRFGIRSDLAFAQMLLETNFLRYGGDVSPWQNNFAGIGATGGGNPGNSFATPELGVIAQYAHLAWYAYPDHVNQWCNSTFDPRHFNDTHNDTAHTLRQLGGKWAVPGTTYGDDIARIANEIWAYPPIGRRLGSFNEMPGAGASDFSTAWYFPWYDSLPQSGMAGNWIMVTNEGAGDARVEITVGGQKMSDPANPSNDFFTIPEGGQIAPSFSDLIGGPVRVISVTGQPLLASQRVLYHDSFNEVPGIQLEQLSDSYEFTWYDSTRASGMGGNWILVSNQGQAAADVDVYIGNTLMARYSAATGNALAPGAIVTPSFPETMDGPVRVVSTNHQPLIASQRVLYLDSFNEVMGFPTSSMGTEYYFNWYDSLPQSGMRGDWLLVANRGSQPATVNIFIGGSLVASYGPETGNAIPPGGIVTPQFPGMIDGPVYVHSLNGQPVQTSQRVLFRDSFEEVQGVLPARLSDSQWFGWYDDKLANFMAGDWLMIANRGTGDARVEIYIGGQKMNDPGNPGNDYFMVPEGGRITPIFNNLMGGPVNVVSTTGQPLLTSQRVLYKDGLMR